MSLIFNPELRRNLWLEFSPARLIAMPAVLFMVLLLAWTWGKDEGMAIAAAVSGWALLVLWGTRLACDAVISEVQGRTWDGQRLSGLGPLRMTIGKLAGGPAYAWYGGAICLLALLGSGGIAGEPLVPISLVVTGLFAQSVALWFGLVQLRLRSGVQRFHVTFAQIVGIAVSVQLAPFDHFFDVTVTWYGLTFDAFEFALMSTAVFTVWAWIGCWRLMRAELQYRSWPLFWCAFLVFLLVYFDGLSGQYFGLFSPIASLSEDEAFLWQAGGFMTVVTASWFAMLLEPKSIVRLRRLLERLGRRDFGRALGDMPVFVAGLPILAISAVLLSLGKPEPGLILVQAASLVLFLLRDAALVYYVVLSGSRRGHLAALVYLVLLYGIVPGILTGADAGPLLAAFVPLAAQAPVIGLLGPGLQAAGFAFLLSTRLTRPKA
ncbi:hypothetical protein DKG74_00860 [Zavarzinia aquatilis]|uniref:Uncharacterized protein n=2 Tax=Zavarzinia aquatilis TaxID=2211142 RepID=A0A317EEV0_9PROT|nr:hypothetical protein DKG74_00860 [Zavarzinia aquatilis]